MTERGRPSCFCQLPSSPFAGSAGWPARPQAIEDIKRLKTNVDWGSSAAIQRAGMAAILRDRRPQAHGR